MAVAAMTPRPLFELINASVEDTKISEYEATAENRLFYADKLAPIVATAFAIMIPPPLYFVFHWTITSIGVAVGVAALVGAVAMKFLVTPVLEALRASAEAHKEKAENSKNLKKRIEELLNGTMQTLMDEATQRLGKENDLPKNFIEDLVLSDPALSAQNEKKARALATMLAHYELMQKSFLKEGDILKEKANAFFHPQETKVEEQDGKETPVDPAEQQKKREESLQELVGQHFLFLGKQLELIFSQALIARPFFAGKLTPDLGSEPAYHPGLRLILAGYDPDRRFTLLELKNGRKLLASSISEKMLCENPCSINEEGTSYSAAIKTLIQAMDDFTSTKEVSTDA